MNIHDLWMTNVRGTFNVMEACIKAGVERLVYSSSASVVMPLSL